MTRSWPVVLVVLLLTAWGVNGIVMASKGSGAELYPMTGFRMFAGGAGSTARTHHLSMPTGEELPASKAFDPEREPPSSVSSRILSNLQNSYRFGCPGYQGPPYDNCPRVKSDPWPMPQDLASLWAEAATKRLDLQEVPEHIDLVLTEVRIEENVELERTLVFRFDPDTGDAWTPEA